jgi:hypothetical protein
VCTTKDKIRQEDNFTRQRQNGTKSKWQKGKKAKAKGKQNTPISRVAIAREMLRKKGEGRDEGSLTQWGISQKHFAHRKG